MNGRFAAMIVAIVLAVVPACSTTRPASSTGASLAPLVSTAEIPGEFLMQQRLRFRWKQQEGQADAVVQMVCGELTVLLLTPFGTPAVVIRQRDRHVEIESKLPGMWTLPPEYVLRDVQRTYFVPIGDPALTEGRRQLAYGGESIDEVWAGGRLVERSFTAERGGTQTRIVIGYPDGATRSEPPRTATIDAPHWDYHLEVTTLSRVELTCLH
jgi:hypothetical protein